MSQSDQLPVEGNRTTPPEIRPTDERLALLEQEVAALKVEVAALKTPTRR